MEKSVGPAVPIKKSVVAAHLDAIFVSPSGMVKQAQGIRDEKKDELRSNIEELVRHGIHFFNNFSVEQRTAIDDARETSDENPFFREDSGKAFENKLRTTFKDVLVGGFVFDPDAIQLFICNKERSIVGSGYFLQVTISANELRVGRSPVALEGELTNWMQTISHEKAKLVTSNDANAFAREAEKLFSNGPCIAFLGFARVDENVTQAAAEQAKLLFHDIVAKANLVPEARMFTVGGGFFSGMTKISYDVGTTMGAGSLVVMPEVGLDRCVVDQNTEERKTNVLGFGLQWGDDSPALTLFSHVAVGFGPFGPWTEIEFANLVRNGVDSVIFLMPNIYSKNYVNQWIQSKLVQKSEDDDDTALNPCEIRTDDGTEWTGGVAKPCFFQVAGHLIPMLLDLEEVAESLAHSDRLDRWRQHAI